MQSGRCSTFAGGSCNADGVRSGVDPPPLGPRRDRDILVKRLRHQGFIIFDHVARFPEAATQLAAWLRKGVLVYREDIEHGLDRAPEALAALYRGENQGKKIIQV